MCITCFTSYFYRRNHSEYFVRQMIGWTNCTNEIIKTNTFNVNANTFAFLAKIFYFVDNETVLSTPPRVHLRIGIKQGVVVQKINKRSEWKCNGHTKYF